VFEIGRSFWMVREVAAPELEPARFEGLDATGTCNPQLVAIQRTLARLAPSDVPLLLCGETGTGKEISARAIHRTSGRRGRFVTANLAALSDDRVDSVLGGAPGAPGVFASATGGTLFFDELGELTPTVQAKLLAAVTESRASGQSPAAVRTICSSLHDVHAMVLRGSFRPDLYSRLVGFSATLPPLRERREDIGLIIRAVSLARTLPARLSTRAFRRLLGHDWPYNVRELEQTVATAAILAASGGEISREVIDEIVERRGDMPKNPESVHALRAQLVDGLARAGGDTTEMARAMARDPAEVQRWLERFELRPEAYRGPRVGGETLAERLGPAGDDE
jgi:DNA-binding NtrC family response regulator